MFLKSLSLRGFKSFADATTLRFEPGVTVIVGPNGSGKSNVVDALVWALGSLSPKSLRGGEMADVIFAGSKARKAMGRASVKLTIDNSGRLLPIAFSEVTVGRAMFASGENTYTINGTECRALDVAELLSDTGLGRQTHTIVGQGQIDAVLSSRPEARRALIEEAAGILKHRRRKERALRKLAQLDDHLERLDDLVRELGRQLRPLQRQARAAREHAEVLAELRSVRRQLAARRYHELRGQVDASSSERQALADELAQLDARAAEERAATDALERDLALLAPRVRAATETHFALAGAAERARGALGRIAERRRGLADAVDEPVAGRDPAELRNDAETERQRAAELAEQLAAATSAVADAREARAEAERRRRAHEQAAAVEARRRAEARERRIRWEGEVTALRGAIAQAAAEEGRLASQLDAHQAHADELDRDVAATREVIQRLDTEQPALAERLRQAEQVVARRREQAADAARREREVATTQASLEARADALLAASSEAGKGVAAVLEAAARGDAPAVRGRLADQLWVEDAYALAVAAALGPLGDALVVEGRAGAEATLALAAAEGCGRVMLVTLLDGPVGRGEERLEDPRAEPLEWAVGAPDDVRTAVRRALAGCYVTPDLRAAAALAEAHPQLVFVTRDGQVAGARGWAGGGDVDHTAVRSRVSAEEAAARAAEVADELRVAHRQVADADRALAEARAARDERQAALAESDGEITEAAARLGRLQAERARVAQACAALEQQREEIGAQTAARRARLQELEERGHTLDDPDRLTAAADDPGADVEAERLADAVDEAREVEVQARLRVTSAQQHHDEAERRAAALSDEADRVEAQLAARERRRQARIAALARCDELERLALATSERAEVSQQLAAGERDRLEEQRGDLQRRLGVRRERLAQAEADVAAARERSHEHDLAHADLERSLRDALDQLAALGVAPDAAVPEEDLGGDHDLGEREQELAAKVELLGPVNPLAVDAYDAARERHDFLSRQMADVRRSKADLLEVVRAVDGRIEEVFAAAFADVAAAFERIFPRLFPGGEGRLLLTDPDDLLTTGVEVEARPPGKRVKRLSLLSGGERSLTAIAVLFSIFTARPSPFYVLDEVEAALDDANLQRFLELLADFQGTSQLIVVTHQRRTMEAADVLYGVSMGADGVSKVYSQRLADSVLVRS